MSGTLRLALAHIGYHWGRSLALVLALGIILAVPLGVSAVLAAAEARLTARAEATPLVIGARGSRLDLVMGALYFARDLPDPVTMASADRVWESGLAAAVPLRLGFEAGGAPIVGTTLDYFDVRGLEIAAGRGLAVLGEAVLGAEVAARLGLGPGDRLTSAPATLFDLAGAYPLRMEVVGVLAPTGTPDDRAVFADIKTVWVIEGIGHGHDDVVAEAGQGTDGRTAAGAAGTGTGGGAVAADPALVSYTEITAETLASFHFHGDPASFPVTAVIALPEDARAATILKGRYLAPDRTEQIVEPAEVIAGLLAQLLAIKEVIDAVVLAVGAAALIALLLAVYLSLELRRGEMETAMRLGAGRWLVARLVAAEAAILLVAAGALAALAVGGIRAGAGEAVAWLVAGA